MSREYAIHEKVYISTSPEGAVVASCDQELERLLDGIHTIDNIDTSGVSLEPSGLYECKAESRWTTYPATRLDPQDQDWSCKLLSVTLVVEYGPGVCTFLPDYDY